MQPEKRAQWAIGLMHPTILIIRGSSSIRDQAKVAGNSMRLQHGAYSNILLVKGSDENGVASGESAAQGTWATNMWKSTP
ncbi:unnamed protein product [Clonostachys solani]|uniref:Uncharacterized protein n=1 Tax=Clonostachys solani TaxID=160281 RepID=A0A9N9W6W9_9HYPO|nr:unnamed protein product [Clonostachys solani]